MLLNNRRKSRTAQTPLVLASQSPRRKKILDYFGISFRVVKPTGVLENRIGQEPPWAMVRRLALKKALEVSKRAPGAVVLGSDTVVVFQGRIFGKPKNKPEAFRMLSFLSGRTHEVWTGSALVFPGEKKARVYAERTMVTFNPIPGNERRAYLSTREPYDKAGAYDIQGSGRKWIKDWKGSYFNIMGLPAEWVLKQLSLKR